MNKYLLTPIDPADPIWKCSDSNEPLTIEAESEEYARQKATDLHMQMSESGSPGEDNPQDPWANDNCVTCELI